MIMKPYRSMVYVALLSTALAGCAATVNTPDPLVEKGLTSRWMSQTYDTSAMLPNDFKRAPLYVDPAPWPALSARYRAALAAGGAVLTDSPAAASYRLRLDGNYRAVAPNNAVASASLEELAANYKVTVGAPPAAPNPMQGFGDRMASETVGITVATVATGGGLLQGLGTLGLTAAFEGLAGATGARQKLQRGMESITGVPASTQLLCGSPETCENIRLMAHNLTQQILLSVDVYRGGERVLRRTARADGHSKQPSLDEGFEMAVKELAVLTMKE